MINKLVIIGVGLIGGSLARALKRAGACKEIVGSGRSEAQLQKAVALGVIDRYEMDARLAVQGADVVVLAVPVGAVEAVLQQIAGQLAPHTIVTDVGSTKASVVEAVRRVFGAIPPNFVPGHPIAGTEQNGVEASHVDLFQQRRVVLTPLATTDIEAVAKVRAMWQCTGAEVITMDVAHHDEVLAATSHLPHLLAYTLVDMLARMDKSEELFQFAASGFRDFTRIAGSNPQMWCDICLANPTAIMAALDQFGDELERLKAAIHQQDSQAILALFTRAQAVRNRLNETLPVGK